MDTFHRKVYALVTSNKERYPEMSLLEIFCEVDDFCQQLESVYGKNLPTQSQAKRYQPGLCASEMITIMLHFHPLVSYTRFIYSWQPEKPAIN
jgi:hypothetical protein